MPGVEAGTAYGSPALKANGRLLATMASNKSAEPDSLCVSLSIPDRDELVLADPDVYYLTPHYEPGPYLVVRLAKIDPEALKDLLLMCLRFCNSRKHSTKARRPRPRK